MKENKCTSSGDLHFLSNDKTEEIKTKVGRLAEKNTAMKIKPTYFSFIIRSRTSSASLSIFESSLTLFSVRNFFGVKLHIRIMESSKPIPIIEESSVISAQFMLNILETKLMLFRSVTNFYPFNANVSFLYPLKTPTEPLVFWSFQGL